MSEYRFTSNSRFEGTLESYALPAVGEGSRRLRRSQAINRMMLALAGFSLAFGIALALAVL